MRGAEIKRKSATPALHLRSYSSKLKKSIKLWEYDYGFDLQGNTVNFGQPSCVHQMPTETSKEMISQKFDVLKGSTRSVSRVLLNRSISPELKQREMMRTMRIRKTAKSSHNMGKVKLHKIPASMTKTSYNRSFNKSQNRVSYYDTRVGSIYFGNTVKDKQLMNFNELIQAQQDDKGKKTIKVEESVKNNIVPNQYRTELEEKPTSKTRTRAIAPVKITNPYYHILMNKKEKEKRKSKSVIQKRKNWNTSSRKENDNDDSPLDLGKKDFGQEYRAVLDKLLEPKLPNDKELQ
mmetsp:Transcript_34938/g.34614  ORF Transcript_34938/g.34614 Transcript_34938/m.34614 type:complete len:292 (+) Transcript_34938:21-896(+)